MINTNEIERKPFETFPVGEYELEIQSVKNKTVGGGYEKVVFFTMVVEPAKFAKKKFTFDLFSNDWKIGDILRQVTKKQLKDLGDSSGTITESIFSNLVEGQFIKVRIGQREHNGKTYNEVAEIIQDKKAEAQLDV